MTYYHIEPEVAGELGPARVYRSTFPSVVDEMEYLLDAWPADDFVQSHPCYAVSARLKASFERAQLSGMVFEPCKVGTTIYYEGSGELPELWRLIPVGVANRDDLALDERHRLIISERVNRILDEYGLEHWLMSPV